MSKNRSPHALKRNHTNSGPRQFVFFDCESIISHPTKSETVHTLDFGYACYVRLAQGNNRRRESWWRFDTPTEFWRGVLNRAELDRSLVVMSYNLDFDLPLVNPIAILPGYDYEMHHPFLTGQIKIMVWESEHHKIKMIDALNYYDGKLAKFGDMIGLPKLGEFDKQPDDYAYNAYCARDVEILRDIFLQLDQWRKDNNLGAFAATKSSMAMNAFRHRFMKRKIYIHRNETALALERSGYYGGRTECYFIGKVPCNDIYCLDFNSLYPSCMHDFDFPKRLIYSGNRITIRDIMHRNSSKAYMGRVLVNTEEPTYPKKHEGKVIFPTGRFWTTLPHPELVHAIRLGRVETLSWCNVYETANLFRDYVRWFYAQRLKYKRKRDDIRATLTKYLLNGLSGKFGQHNRQWVECDPPPGFVQGINRAVDVDLDQEVTYYLIGDKCWMIAGYEESINSFPAIIAFITSYARLRLWYAQRIAGRENVYYSDTDSLYVNRQGYENLLPLTHPRKLGYLGCEGRYSDMLIRGLKDYVVDGKERIKGVKDPSNINKDGSYNVEQWRKIRGALNNGEYDRVRIRKQIKRYKREYSKGYVDVGGFVTPLLF